MNKKHIIIIGILLWIVVFEIILYFSYMYRVDKYFHNVKESAIKSEVLNQKFGKVNMVKYDNFMQWVSTINGDACIKLKIYTNKGKYKVCALLII